MRTLPLALAAIATLSAPAMLPAASPAAKAVPAKVDWTKVVADTGTGWRMGNPKAATKLVEYGSFNCPHCAAFAAGAMPVIRKKVASGQMNFEFRPKQLFPHDPPATLLAHCVGKPRVFAFTEDYMANQDAVLARLRAAYKADHAVFDKAGDAAGTARAMARIGDMAPIAQRAGVTPARANQCLGDAALIARVEANEKAALAAGVKGTPTFFINGQRVEPDALAKLGIPIAL